MDRACDAGRRGFSEKSHNIHIRGQHDRLLIPQAIFHSIQPDRGDDENSGAEDRFSSGFPVFVFLCTKAVQQSDIKASKKLDESMRNSENRNTEQGNGAMQEQKGQA